MKCPVCRATYRVTESLDRFSRGEATPTKPCHRCGADLAPLIELHDRAIAHHRLAIAHFAADDLSAATIENDRAISLHSHNAGFHAFAGQLFALQGQFDRATRSWQLSQQIDPKNILANLLTEMRVVG